VAGQTVLSLAYNQDTWSNLAPPAIQGNGRERRAELRMTFFFFKDYLKIGLQKESISAEIKCNPHKNTLHNLIRAWIQFLCWKYLHQPFYHAALLPLPWTQT